MRILILLFALGVGVCQLQRELVAPQLPLLLASVFAMAACVLRAPYWRRLCLYVLVLSVGFGWANWRASQRLTERLPAALERSDLSLEGRIVGLPQQTARGTRFGFAPLAPRDGVPRRLLLNAYERPGETLAPFRAGEVWRLTVRLRQPHGNLNPHGFDYEAWLFERGIGALGYVRNATRAQRTAQLAAHPMAYVDRWREQIRARFVRALPDSAWRGVLVALVVGDQASISEAQWSLFRQTGVTHLMSISGLHVTMLAALATWLVQLAWRRVPALALRLPAQQAALPLGVCVAGFYVLIAGAGVPAQRTFFMLLVAAAALCSGRLASATRVMAAALLGVLLVDPWAVLAAGFWLSFGAVSALLLVAGNDRAGMRRWSARVRAWGRVQWAVTLLSLPILLALFQQFSLVSPLANLVAIPVVSVLVTPLALLFALFPLDILARLADVLLGALMRLLEVLASLPVAIWQQAAPPLVLVVLGAIAVLWALLPRGVPARWVALLVCVPMLRYAPARPAAGEFFVSVLDVGQGLAVHVQTQHSDLVFDTGARYSALADAGSRVLVPYLRASGVRAVDMLVVSHADIDHAGGVASLMREWPVRAWRSSIDDAHPLRAQAAPHQPCLAGSGWEQDGVRFEFLHPAAAFRGNDNERSCVLDIAAPHGRVLLTGDIAKRGEAALLAATQGIAADLLIAPHHGSRTSSGEAFVQAVGPAHVVFTNGYLNRFGHPAPEVVARYASTGARLYRSDHDGAVVFRFTSDATRVERSREARRRYWHFRAPAPDQASVSGIRRIDAELMQ